MNVYTNNEFKGHYPVGSAAVVVAETKDEAAMTLSDELAKIGLRQIVTVEDMVLLDTSGPSALVLNDGNY